MSIFAPARNRYHLNITPDNVAHVFPFEADGDLNLLPAHAQSQSSTQYRPRHKAATPETRPQSNEEPTTATKREVEAAPVTEQMPEPAAPQQSKAVEDELEQGDVLVQRESNSCDVDRTQTILMPFSTTSTKACLTMLTWMRRPTLTGACCWCSFLGSVLTPVQQASAELLIQREPFISMWSLNASRRTRQKQGKYVHT